MKEYKLDEIEKKKYSNTCFKLDNLYKMLQNQQEYDIYKACLNAKVVTFYFGSKEYQELKKELNIRAKKRKTLKNRISKIPTLKSKANKTAFAF